MIVLPKDRVTSMMLSLKGAVNDSAEAVDEALVLENDANFRLSQEDLFSAQMYIKAVESNLALIKASIGLAPKYRMVPVPPDQPDPQS